MTRFQVDLKFHGDLPFFLKSKKSRVGRLLKERTSVKDVIEACGIPHTEVDLILIDDRPKDFQFVIGQEAQIDIYGTDEDRVTCFPEDRLQVRDIRTFVADGHLGKLVRDLRLLGLDVLCDRSADDRRLVAIAAAENRALLTRDRRLLMHSAIRHGRYLRSQNPLDQTLEVLRRFRLQSELRPFSRCLRCNTPLKPVPKAEILDRLEPLTKIYYEQFCGCAGCGQVYWSGSHFAKLQDRIAKITAGL